jgi:hypothetical protein
MATTAANCNRRRKKNPGGIVRRGLHILFD